MAREMNSIASDVNTDAHSWLTRDKVPLRGGLRHLWGGGGGGLAKATGMGREFFFLL